MGTLLATFSASDILLILIIGLPYLFKFFKALYNGWKEIKARKQDVMNEARLHAEEELKTKLRFEAGEQRIKKLEEDDASLTSRIDKTEERIKLLTDSDKLRIKREIKKEHDRAMLLGYIDGQTLDLLEQEFDIYTQEGGNGWALRMMNDMRSLPSVLYQDPTED